MMEATLLYVHAGGLGYGRLGVELARSLRDAGVDLYDQIEREAPNRLDTAKVDERSDYRHKMTNVACWVSVPTHASGWWEGQTAAIFTMWEATRLPESFRETIHNFDTVLVPSEHNVELFSRYHPRVRKVPLGVDPDVWHYTPRRPPGATFTFLIGGSGPRKGTDLAVKAFRALWGSEGSWGDGPEPRLILKSPRPQDLFGRGISQIGGKITAEAEVSLYASAHCYLAPARGEGFGLQPLQAIAQGCPTILTGAHGHADFAHLGFALREWTMEKASYFIYGDAGEWWEPNLDELCDWMRLVYDDYDDACAVAKHAAGVVAQRWTWAHTAQGWIEAIGADRLSAPYTGSGRWHQAQSRYYRARMTRPAHCEIAGRTYHFEVGEDYWVPADVKRVMWEAGHLDPECSEATDDIGITAEQAEAYEETHRFCPTCHQRYGSGESRSDTILAAM